MIRLIASIVLLAFSAAAQAEVARFSPYDNRTVVAEELLSLADQKTADGGILRQGVLGSFNSLNLMSFKGIFPASGRFAHDSLMVAAPNDLHAFHGLLAKRFLVSDDYSKVLIELDPDARWHDGTPVTAEDVKFTVETVLANSSFALRLALGPITVTIADDLTLTMENGKKGSWQWLQTAATYPIQSSAYWRGKDTSASTMDIPLGSGPYKIVSAEPNRQVVLERARDYWAADHPVNADRWHFDRISVDYFTEPSAVGQALIAGGIDILLETDATRWRAGYDSPSLTRGDIVKTAIGNNGIVVVPALFFNLRRSIWQDLRVRTALKYAIDTDFLNRITGEVYKPAVSYFGSLPHAATGVPTSAEAEVLAEFEDDFPAGAFASPTPSFSVSGLSQRDRFRRASALLQAAGYQVINGQRIDPATGQPMSLDLLITDATIARRLAPITEWFSDLGIELKVDLQDAAIFVERRNAQDYDLLFLSLNHSGLPGFVENFFWHSRFAATGFSISGLENRAVDAFIDQMQSTRELEKITVAAQAFDRFMRWNVYALPLWQQDETWFVHASGLIPPTGSAALSAPAVFWKWSAAENRN